MTAHGWEIDGGWISGCCRCVCGGARLRDGDREGIRERLRRRKK